MSLFSLLGFGPDPSRQAFGRNQQTIAAGIGAGSNALTGNFGQAQALLGTGVGGDALTALGDGYQGARNSVLGGNRNAANILQQLGPAAGQAINAGGSAARSDLLGGYASARSALGAGYGAADDVLTQLGSGLNRTIGQGAQQTRRDLAGGYGDAKLALARGYSGQRGALQQATSAYDPMVQQGGAAYNAYSDSIGANGAAGNDRALTNFQDSLGYQAGLNTGLDAVMRSAAARGQLGGGNTSKDLFDYASDHQNQQSQRYIDNLAGGSQLYAQGVTGRAAGLGAQADAAQGYGSAQSTLAQNRGTALANAGQTATAQRIAAQQGVGMARAGLQTDRGAALAGLSTGQGTALGNLDLGIAGQRLGQLNSLGGQRVNLATGQGTTLGNLASQYGSQRAGVYGTGASGFQQLGTGLANLQQAGMNASVQNSNNLAQAQNQQDANGWSALLGLGSLALAPATGGLSGTLGGRALGAIGGGLGRMMPAGMFGFGGYGSG